MTPALTAPSRPAGSRPGARGPARALARLLAVLVLVAAAAGLAAAPASAHPMPSSTVVLDAHGGAISAELHLPVDDLALATGLDLGQEAVTGAAAGTATVLTGEQITALRAYLSAHVRPSTPDGTPWAVTVGQLSVGEAEQTSTGLYREVVAQVQMTPPAGADAGDIVLAYDAVVAEVVTHTALVSVNQDGAGAREAGVVRTDTATMTVLPLQLDLDGSGPTGFDGMLALGGHHILEGTDHLLFLLTLLLPAPLLLAAGRRWGGPVGLRHAIRRIAGITLAFTLGHSATLAIGALGVVQVPAGPVEALIAASILVSAAHAVRPIFPGREVVVAGVFGLVHGLTFSLALADLELSTGQLVLSLLGFNLGIELLQLLVVALVLPPLLVLSRTRAYPPLRVAGAALAATAALGWLLDRVGVPNPVARAADSLGQHSGWVVMALALAAGAVLLRGRLHAPDRAIAKAPAMVAGQHR